MDINKMKAPKYAVENSGSSGNAAILEQQTDGTYAKIAFAAGDSNLNSVIDLVNLANAIYHERLVDHDS